MEIRQLRRMVKIVMMILMALRFIRAHPPEISKLHKIMSKREMIKYLDTHSHQDVPEYEVASLTPIRERRSTEDHRDGVKFSAFQNTFDIKLKPSNEFVSANLVVDKRHRHGRFTREVYNPRGKFYHGELASNKNSFVAVRDKENTGKLSGTIVNGEYIYKVVPLPDHLTSHVRDDRQGLHIISRRSLHSRENKRSQPIKVPLDGIIAEKLRAKRSNRGLGQKWIEAMILADITTVNYYGNETMDYVLGIANLVNRLFQDPSLGVNVTFSLVKVYILEGYEPELDFKKNNIRSAGNYLGAFKDWAAKRNPSASHPHHWDNAVLLTRRLCGLKPCYLDGLAYFGVPCSKWMGVSVNDAHGLGSGFSVAHELAHNLNVDHDGKGCRGGSIMSAVASTNAKSFHWSNCSRKAMTRTMSILRCYDNKPKSVRDVTKRPAGRHWSADRQCQMKYGAGVRECWMTTGVCHDPLMCTRGSNCFGRGHPPADGTKCGPHKWCIKGQCVSDATTRPPPVDGNWGPWQDFSPCSRTCGGGTRHRKRTCNNPSPQNDGKNCFGESKGYYEMCNLQACLKGNYRQEQCASFNSNTSQYWDYFRADAPCSRVCRKGNIAYLKSIFNDGTPCSLDQSADLRCANGKCQAFHCDGKQRNTRSNIAVRDRCKVCNGRGDRCRRIRGRFIREWRYWGPQSATVMLRIPAGATNIKIVEDKMSNNLLNLKADPPNGSGFIVPVISTTTKIPFAGTMVNYYRMNKPRQRILYQEKMTISGPTNQLLNVMYIWIGPEGNPGFTYSYYAPLNSGSVVPSPITEFQWKFSTEISCTATCAGGVRRRKLTCHRSDDDTLISTMHCDPKKKPSDTEACNIQPCPPYWQTGDWNGCSQACGGGVQTRSVKCVRLVNRKSKLPVVKDSLCGMESKPIEIQTCNQINCKPKWKFGEWSKCSALCDNGVQHRSVKCQQRLGNGSIMAHVLEKCRNSTGTVMADRRSCNRKHCKYRWTIQYNCDECKAGYKHVGCYKDNLSRAIPKLLGLYSSNELVKKCAEAVKSDGYTTFGAEYSAECWSGPRANESYDKYGPSSNCHNGVGGVWANDVYFLVNDALPLVRCQLKKSGKTISPWFCLKEGHKRPNVHEKQPCSKVCH